MHFPELTPNTAHLDPGRAIYQLETPVLCCAAGSCPSHSSKEAACRKLPRFPLSPACEHPGSAMPRLGAGVGAGRVVGDAGCSSQAASGRVTRYSAPGFGVILAVTHFPHPLTSVQDGNGSAEAEAASV